jgi:hypothetical protein
MFASDHNPVAADNAVALNRQLLPKGAALSTLIFAPDL